MEFKKITDFIRDLYGGGDFIPLSVPVFAGNEKKYLNECIDTTFVSSVGKFVDRFEDDIAKYTGCKRAVVCVSGTNALHISLMLAKVPSYHGQHRRIQVLRRYNSVRCK